MLIISRRVGERICIGEGIEVVVTEVTRKGVRLGIAAPTETPILRGEVRDAIEQANRAAAGSTLDPALLPGSSGASNPGLPPTAAGPGAAGPGAGSGGAAGANTANPKSADPGVETRAGILAALSPNR